MDKQGIVAHYDKKWEALTADIDRKCERRAKTLLNDLKPLGIKSVTMSMGTWSFNGPDIEVRWQDGETGTRMLDELDGWVKDGWVTDRNPLWAPVVNLNDAERRSLIELIELLDWWVEITGGTDVEL